MTSTLNETDIEEHETRKALKFNETSQNEDNDASVFDESLEVDEASVDENDVNDDARDVNDDGVEETGDDVEETGDARDGVDACDGVGARDGQDAGGDACNRDAGDDASASASVDDASGKNDGQDATNVDDNRAELERTPNIQESWHEHTFPEDVQVGEKSKNDDIQQNTLNMAQQMAQADSFADNSNFAKNLAQIETRQTAALASSSKVTVRQSTPMFPKKLKQSKLQDVIQYSIMKTNERAVSSDGETAKRPNSSLLESPAKLIRPLVDDKSVDDEDDDFVSDGSFQTVTYKKNKKKKQ